MHCQLNSLLFGLSQRSKNESQSYVTGGKWFGLQLPKLFIISFKEFEELTSFQKNFTDANFLSKVILL